jgi:proline iminopeptidase
MLSGVVYKRKGNALRYVTVVLACALLVVSSDFQQIHAGNRGDNPISTGEFTAEINGLRLWYKVSGNGPVCILPTPGWGPSSELYYLKLKPLESMFTMVYLDTRGSGRSERPGQHAYSMHDFAADIEGLRKHLGTDSVWLMGHSDGGIIILNYASEHSNHVAGMILVDAPAGNTSKSNDRILRMQRRKGEPWFDSAFAAFQRVPATQHEFESNMRSILPFFFASFENVAKNRDTFENVSFSFDAQRGRGESDPSSVELGAFLPGTKIPTLVVVGEDDFICPPPAAEYFHKEIVGSKLLVIENAGHFPWLEQPEQFFGGIGVFLPKLGFRKEDR